VVILESSWTFAAGQTVRAESSFLNQPPPECGLFALTPMSQSPPSSVPGRELWPTQVVTSFLSRADAQRVNLLEGFVPQSGSRGQVDGLLVYGPRETEAQVLRVTVTAF
jgi:hypothetical protein